MKIAKRVLSIISIFLCMWVLMYPQTIYAQETGDYGRVTKNDLSHLRLVLDENLDITSFSYELVSSFNDLNRYILVEGNNQYLIYDRYISGFAEYSTKYNSPYYNESLGLKIYFGPGKYYYQYQDIIFTVGSNEIIEEENLLALKESEQSFKQTLVQNKILIEQEQKISSSIFNNKTNQTVESVMPMSSPTTIDNGYYFQNLNNNIGASVQDSCYFIATGMMLSYYDTFFNDSIIDEQYDSPTIMENVTSPSRLRGQNFTESPGTTNDFNKMYVQIGKDLGYVSGNNSGGISSGHTTIISEYFNRQNIDITIQKKSIFQSHYNFIKQAINNNYPVCVDYDYEFDKGHASVAYGYTNNGILVHDGELNRTATIIASNRIAISFHFTFNNLQPSYSNNYMWNGKGCTGYFYGASGGYSCNHETVKYNHTSSMHTLICNFCSSQREPSSEHNFLEVTNEHYKQCLDCGFRVCLHTAGYEYKDIDHTTHSVSCILCKINFNIENHTYVNGVCTVCGYTHHHFVHSGGTVLNNHQHTIKCEHCSYSEVRNHVFMVHPDGYRICGICLFREG